MNKIFLSILLFLFLSETYSQTRILENLETDDTVKMKIEKIASLYGLDSRTIIYITKSSEEIKLSFNGDRWQTLKNTQFKELKKFERKGIKFGCLSTQYAQVEMTCFEKKSSYRTCWENVNLLIEKLK